MTCTFYTFRSGDYYCLKKGGRVSDDVYYKYCRNWDYDDCPIYNDESNSSSGGCYLTSACVRAKGLPDDCYELQVLRQYRDSWLTNTEEGKAIVEEYYKIAPGIVDAIDALEDSNVIYEEIYQIVKNCVRCIENKEYDEALALYKEMTIKLKEEYCK